MIIDLSQVSILYLLKDSHMLFNNMLDLLLGLKACFDHNSDGYYLNYYHVISLNYHISSMAVSKSWSMITLAQFQRISL